MTRYMELMKAASLTNAPYTWDAGHSGGHYHLILEREAYETEVVSVAATDIVVGDNVYAETVQEYILPRTFGNVTPIDGIAWGNMEVKFEYTIAGMAGTTSFTVYIHAHIAVLARNSAGTDRTLATYDITEMSKAWSTVGNGTANYYEAVPLRINFDNQKLLASERLILQMTYHGKYTPGGIAELTLSCAQMHTIGTNELYIEIPLAGM